jgi:16S rRNA (uracil1498-N3)-methyltransferase
LGFRLQVAAPLPKGDRADLLIEKLTELGTTDFFPLRTVRSVVHPRESKLERLQRTVIEASKQCGRNVLMKIHPLTEWTVYCRSPELNGRKLLAHPAGNAVPGDFGVGDTCLAVGPEGGFTEEEIRMGQEAGWKTISLGPRILRIETATIALAAIIARAGAPAPKSAG